MLAPLFARAKARGGRLRRDQRVPFRLVVEFVGPSRDAETLLRAYRMLDQQLRDHAPLLSRCADGRLVPGAVTVAVAGIVDVRELLAAQRRRYAFADGTFDDIGSRSRAARPGADDQRAVVAPVRLGRPGADLRRGAASAARHGPGGARGRPYRPHLRVCPTGSRSARRAIWTELGAAGVDVIADTDQRGLARHLRRHPVQRAGQVRTCVSRPARRPAPAPRATVSTDAARRSRAG